VDVATLAPLEIGFAWRDGGELKVKQFFIEPVGFFTVDKVSMSINQLTPEHLQSGIPSPWLDVMLSETPDFPAENNIAVGWNVGTFDLAIAQKWFPNFRKCFHPYRSCDLNSIIFFLTGGDEEGTKELKEGAKVHAKEQLSHLDLRGEHSAGWDAAAGLLALEYLRETLEIME
jgi:hypothetical protein